MAAGAGLDRPTQVFLAIVFGFVVGSACVLWVRMLHVFLNVVFRRLGRRWNRLLEFRLVPWAGAREAAAVGKAGAAGRGARSLYVRFVRARWAALLGRRERRDRLRGAWALAASALLRRYGVGVPKRPTDVWSSVIGQSRPERVRGNTFIGGMHATGWAGLAAMYCVPSVSNRPLRELCFFLILCGLVHAVNVASSWADPMLSWLVGFRCTWAELRALGPVRSTDFLEGSQPPGSDQPE